MAQLNLYGTSSLLMVALVLTTGTFAFSQAEPAGPPKGLEFLKPYPKLHGLSLEMTEPQFLTIAKEKGLNARQSVANGKRNYHLGLGDGHTLIVMFDRDAKCSGIQRIRGEEEGAERAPVPLGILDTAPMHQCRALIEKLDKAGNVKSAAMARERLATRYKGICDQPTLAFIRPLPPRAGGEGEVRSGELTDVQIDLDGVWSAGKGSIENWKDWVVRKQNDYRTGRLNLLFEAAQGYRKVDDATSAKRVLIAGLTGHEIYDVDLKILIAKYWPVTSDEPAKSLGDGPKAWTLVNYLDELSSAQQALGEIEPAINTQSRLTLAHFMLSWNHPSAGPTKQARELWSLVRQNPDALPPLFWFNVVDEKKPEQKFDLSNVGKKGEPLTYHHQNLAAAAPCEFKELNITAKVQGRKGYLSCYRINADGKHETIGLLQPSATGEEEQTLTKKLQVPAKTSLVQFMVAGEGFQVGEVTVQATLAD